MLTRSSLSYCPSSSSLRSAYSATTDPATSSKVASSVSSEAYFNARESSRGWRETAGTDSDELPGVSRDVIASSFFFLLFLVERPLRYDPLVNDFFYRRTQELGTHRQLFDISSITVTIVQSTSFRGLILWF